MDLRHGGLQVVFEGMVVGALPASDVAYVSLGEPVGEPFGAEVGEPVPRNRLERRTTMARARRGR